MKSTISNRMQVSSSLTAFWLVMVSVCVSAMASPIDLMKGNQETDPSRMLENCRDIAGRPYVGYFPSSTNCSTFYLCHSTGPGDITATRLSCPVYRDGYGRQRLLYWNHYRCTCDYPWNTKCYDLDSDYIYRFNCAERLYNLHEPARMMVHPMALPIHRDVHFLQD